MKGAKIKKYFYLLTHDALQEAMAAPLLPNKILLSQKPSPQKLNSKSWVQKLDSSKTHELQNPYQT